MRKISIIIPCYNCQKTLAQSLESVFSQSFKIPFEIIMVDDASTDKTRELIVDFSKKYPEIKYFFHEHNRGGGATRNTGIAQATGDLIYCLDSDNVLTPGSLLKMIDYLDEKKCEGVVFEERRFFLNNNFNKYNSHFNQIIDRPLALTDLFDSSDTLLDNFLFTKESYQLAQGYPENHGFDTQDFEVRYLSKPNKVFVCPGTVFLHRVFVNDSSYFQRVYRNGEMSMNYYLIYENIIDLFSDRILKELINFDIFENNKLVGNNLKDYLHSLYEQDPKDFFGDKRVETNKTFCLGVKSLKENKYQEALNFFVEVLKNDNDTKVVFFDILRALLGIAHKSENAVLEKETQKLIASMVIKGSRSSSLKKIIRLAYRVFPGLGHQVVKIKLWIRRKLKKSKRRF